jgi:RNA polymerase sigma factor (sigma-70 family)
VTAARRHRRDVEDLLREAAPRVLAAVVRRFGDFADSEDAVQEAMIDAARQWPTEGTPESPVGWLIAVASRRMTDRIRADSARRSREERLAAEPEPGPGAEADDTLALIFMCCRPELSPASAIALTLRAVGGLTTAEIAAAFLVPESTMAQRISRAKQTIKAGGSAFELPPAADRSERLRAVAHVLYLVFNEGYTSTGGQTLQRVELAAEAIRLARMLHGVLPDDDETTGLLALMLLTHARRRTRTGPGGVLVPLADQDRTRWDRDAIIEGVGLVERTLAAGAVGPFQLQAAIAAVHAEAAEARDTDWTQILALYTLLVRVAPNPMFSLNRAVAVAMVHGPAAGLAALAAVQDDPHLAGHHRLESVRAHMLELSGDRQDARAAYRAAARLTDSLPERRYLESRAAAM